MDEKHLEHSVILTVILFFIVGIINTFFNLVLRESLGLRFTGSVAIALGSFITGWIYSNELKKGMGRKLKLKVSGIYTVVQLLLGPLFILYLEITDPVFYMIYIALSLAGFLLVYVFLYVGSGCALKGKIKGRGKGRRKK